MHMSPGPPHITMWEFVFGEPVRMLVLWPLLLLGIIKSFASDLGVLCLLPASMKQYQANLLTDKISVLQPHPRPIKLKCLMVELSH